MKARMKPAVYCTVSALALSLMGSTMTMAANTATDNTALKEINWESRAVADVTDELFIRSGASGDSVIVGHMPSAGGAYVLEKGSEWTKIMSGDVAGYVRTEYLAFGEDAKALAQVYGTPGVVTSWDGVNIFNDANPAANIVNTVSRGADYEILSDEGLWVSIQMENGTSAYVPAEDVKETIILEEAVANDNYVTPSSAYNNSYSQPATGSVDNTYTDYVPETEATESWTPETNAPETWVPETAATESWTPETSAPETWAPETEATESWTPETSAPETNAPETSAPETEAPSVDASSDDLTLLASIIYCEAGNQSWDGKVAVGAVVLNRVASPSFAGTIRDVIYESGQFMPTWDGGMSSALANGVPSECYDAANAALSGENPVGGALFFNTGANKGIQIGAHWFW